MKQHNAWQRMEKATVLIAAIFFIAASAGILLIAQALALPILAIVTALTILYILLFLRYRRQLLAFLQGDALTGFILRRLIPQKVIKTKDDGEVYLLYFYVPTLKHIREHHGEKVEITAIDIVARIMKQEFKKYSPIFYNYGDHTSIALVETSVGLNNLIMDLSRIIQGVYQVPVPVTGTEDMYPFTMHIGVSCAGISGDVTMMIEQARFALKGTIAPLSDTEPSVKPFNKELYDARKRVKARQKLVAPLIEKNEIKSVYQPIQDCHTGELYGYEALGRPNNPAFKHIGQLLNDAESADIYTQLEIALTYNAVTTYSKLVKRKGSIPRLFINVAPAAVTAGAYDNDMASGFFPDIPYSIEIVERGEILPELIAKLRKMVEPIDAIVALDDFGTGYSNHLALLNSRPDVIKVARELLMGIDKDVDKQHIYSNIVMFAGNLDTKILAEGVETREEFETLLRLGMDYCQGWFVGRPNEELLDVSEESRQLCRDYHKI